MASLQDLFDDLRSAEGLAPPERTAAAKNLVEKCGYVVAAMTVLPLPFTESVGAIPVHVGMVAGIGRLHGHELTRESAQKLLLRIGGTVGLSYVGSRLALGAAKLLIPGLPGLLGAPFMYASTLALGAVARVYFERQGELSDDEMRAIYKDTLKSAKREFDPRKARSAEAQDLARAAANGNGNGNGNGAEPAPAPATDGLAAKVAKLEELRDQGLLDEGEFEEAKRRLESRT